MRRPAPVLALVLAFLLAACGGDDTTETADTTATSESSSSTTSSTTATTTTTTAPPTATCSTSGLRIELVEQDLPPAVADLRRRMFEAAVTCDLETLAALANEGEFTASFGGGEVPALWEELERVEGEEPPLRTLVLLLNMTPVLSEGRYVWPAAFARETWDDVTRAERDELAPLYDEDDQAFFADFGAYVGYRVGITAEGDWTFFVGGD